MSAKYKSPSFLLPNELNTSANTANDTGINSLYSMDFDSSSSDYIDIGTISSLNAQQNFSISLWFKENVRRTNGFMFSSGTGVSNDIAINAANGTLKINVGGTRNVNTTSYSSNVWYHVVLTVENTTAKVYLNNGSPTTVTVGSNTSSSSGTLAKIGDLSFASGYYFDGKIDEVAIFNRTLNTTEIAALYGGTSPNIYPSNLMATDLNPIAYYPLGEQAQNTGYVGSGDPGNPTTLSNVWQFPNGVLQDYVMDFDSTSPGDYISAPMTMLNSATQCTISFWGKKDASNKQLNVGGWESDSAGVWINWYIDGTLYFSPRGTGAGSFNLSYTQPYDNNWHHFLGVYDGSSAANCKLYLDGNLVATGSGTAPSSLPATTGDNFQIGALGTSYLSDGQISNVAVWNTAITDANQIANIYNNGSPQTTYTVTPQNWWKLNADSVYTPSAPNYTTALDFDGSSDYINFGNPTELQITANLTISLWFKTSTSLGVRLASKDYGSSNRCFGAYISNGQLGFFIFKSNVFSGVLSTTNNSNDNNWHNAVFINNGTSLSIYIDGALRTSPNTAGGTIDNDVVDFEIGRRQDNSQHFPGSISNVSIWNEALSASQVSTLFNFGTPETNISFSPTAWWKLDDQTAITDYGSGGINGTNNGATDISSGVAVIPSWKIPSALPITTTPNYTTALDFVPNDYINCGNDSSLNIYNDITISAWIKADLFGAYNLIIGRSTNKDYDFGVYSTASGGAMRLHSGNGGQENVVSTGTFLKTGEWYHLAVTRTVSPNEATFFINGQQLNTASLTKTPIGSTDITRIGSRSGSFSFDGEISNVSIFNTDLTPSQISTLYNNGTPETAISFSPVSWWKLDNLTTGIQDSVGSNNGTNNGATQVTSDVLTTQPVNGVSTTLPSTALQQSDLQFDSPYSNYSLNFDGTGDYIDCTDNDIFSFGDGGTDSPFSISAWVNFSDVTNSMILSKHTTGQFEYSFLVMSNDKLIFQLNSQLGSNLISRYYNTPITSYEGQWIHLIGTYDGSSLTSGIKIYLNGTRVDDTDFTSGTYVAMNNGTAPVEIGKRSTDYMNGKIDETAIFNTELTSSQILEIYNNGRPKDLTTFSGTAPISWWRLGENAYFDNNSFIVPNSITGAPNGTGAGTITTMISADAPGTYANGIGTNLAILDRVGDAPLSTSNSQSYNMIPDNKIPYVPKYVGNQIANNFSMTFSGVLDYISLGNPNILQITGAISLSFWFNSTASTFGFITKSDNGSYFSSNASKVYEIGVLSNTLYWQIGDGTNVSNLPLAFSSYLDGNWHHVVATWDGSTNASSQMLFVDGLQVGSHQATISAIQNKSNNVIISSQSASYDYVGKLDEVAIFDKALTADQIKFDLYKPTAEGANQTADIANNPNLPTPVAWYRMGD